MRAMLLGMMALLAPIVSPAAADDRIEFLDMLAGLTHAQCTEVLEARTVAFKRVELASGVTSIALAHILESHRTACEVLRLESEVRRLADQQERLAGEIGRLDEAWARAAATDASLTDFPGRRRSQEIMRETIDDLAKSIGNLNSSAADLRAGSRRIYLLAVADAAEARARGTELAIIEAADTGDPLNDVLERILGKGKGVPGLLAQLQVNA